MRDQVSQYSAATGTYIYWRDGQVLQESTYQKQSIPIRLAARADAVATERELGSYIHPTDYWAYQYTCDILTPFDQSERRVLHLPNSNVCSWVIYKDERYYWLDKTPTGLIGTFGMQWALDHYVPDVPGYIVSRADQSLQAKVHQQEWNAAQFFGELPETVELLVSACTRLLKAYKYAKEGRFIKAMITLGVDEKRIKKARYGNAASMILEYQYGWKPLMSDIFSIAEFIQEGMKTPLSEPITVKEEVEFDFSDRDFSNSRSVHTYSGQGRYVVKSAIRARIDNATLARLGSHGLTNPVGLAWELFPLSFVIDWFIPVGNFLQGFQTAFGYEFADGYRTRKVEWENTLTAETIPGYDCPDERWHGIAYRGGVAFDAEFSVFEKVNCFDRQLLPFPPPPVPYWDPKLNTSKITSLGVLLAGILSS